MRMARWLTLAVMMAFATLATGATESGGGEKSDLPGFKEADKNDDGKLTFDEIKGFGIAKEKFQQEDLDNDGELSEYDYKYGIK